MDNYQINGSDLASFFIGGGAYLNANKEMVNSLNVFPVPDGDTGTNMGLTMASAVKNILGSNDASQVANKVANGALMGARGNSGVILSQIFRGFGQGLESKKTIKAVDFAIAMQKGVDLAYRSVMRPVEGTILTVSKAMAKFANAETEKNPNIAIVDLIRLTIKAGKKALDNTPNQLPALKQAGVVDAGGMGLLCIFDGGLKALLGEEFSQADLDYAKPQTQVQAQVDVDDKSNLKYCYCTEFFIHGNNIDVEKIRTKLADMGDSQVIVGNEEMIKTHIHTDNPGAVLAYAIGFGSLHDLKIENMKDQHREKIGFEYDQKDVLTSASQPAVPEQPEIPLEDQAKCGVVAVASGEGFENIFLEMGVSSLVSGGQSMNPSAEEIVNAIKATPAQEIIVLPNNSNIILAAEQAQKLVEKPVYIVPTKFLTQGLAAMMAFDADATGEENKAEMLTASQEVKSAQITYAVRDSMFGDLEIHENDFLGLLEGNITAVETSLEEVLRKLLAKMVTEDMTLVTLLYGNDVTKDEAQKIANLVEQEYPDLEVEVQTGGQEVYFYLISVE